MYTAHVSLRGKTEIAREGKRNFLRLKLECRSLGKDDVTSYEEEDTCMSYEEEDAYLAKGDVILNEEEDTCMSNEEEDAYLAKGA